MSSVEPHEAAFEYSPRTILRGSAHRWRIECRLWNVDAGPTPKERKQYLLARQCPVLCDRITEHVTEAVVDAKFDVLDTPHVTVDETPTAEEGQS